VFRDMLADGVLPDNVALAVALAACHRVSPSTATRNPGRMVHALVVVSGIVPDVFVSTELIRVYGECADLSASRRVFDKMPVRSTVSWNAMMHQYVRHGNVNAAYDLFPAMPKEGCGVVEHSDSWVLPRWPMQGGTRIVSSDGLALVMSDGASEWAYDEHCPCCLCRRRWFGNRDLGPCIH
jgi:pentatricopeptide repeat protein